MPFPIQSIGSGIAWETIHCVDMEIIRNKQSYFGGITLPVRVKSRRALEQSSEDPWSPIEDSALQQCVMRGVAYIGMWQLAASSGRMTFPPSQLVEWEESGGNSGKAFSLVQ